MADSISISQTTIDSIAKSQWFSRRIHKSIFSHDTVDGLPPAMINHPVKHRQIENLRVNIRPWVTQNIVSWAQEMVRLNLDGIITIGNDTIDQAILTALNMHEFLGEHADSSRFPNEGSTKVVHLSLKLMETIADGLIDNAIYPPGCFLFSNVFPDLYARFDNLGVPDEPVTVPVSENQSQRRLQPRRRR